MTTLTFDALKYTRTLEDAGVSRAQAEAQIKANTQMFTELLENSIASKADVLSVRTEMGSLREEMHQLTLQMKDMQIRIGALIVGMGAFLAAIKFFGG